MIVNTQLNFVIIFEVGFYMYFNHIILMESNCRIFIAQKCQNNCQNITEYFIHFEYISRKQIIAINSNCVAHSNKIHYMICCGQRMLKRTVFTSCFCVGTNSIYCCMTICIWLNLQNYCFLFN